MHDLVLPLLYVTQDQTSAELTCTMYWLRQKPEQVTMLYIVGPGYIR
jgi:hypothetical protein